MGKDIHSSTIYSSPKREILMPTNIRMDKEIVLYSLKILTDNQEN